MIQIENVSRRGFLEGNGGSGRAWCWARRFCRKSLFGATACGTGEDPMAKAALQPNVYLAIDTDGTVYIVCHRSEMGSGNRTGLPRIVADELDADWNRVKVVQATGDEKYGDQDTDGSHSVVSFFDAAAGSRRERAVDAGASGGTNVERAGKRVHDRLNTVVHKPSGKKLGYGELAAAAAKLPVPKKEELQLKPRNDWRVHREARAELTT